MSAPPVHTLLQEARAIVDAWEELDDESLGLAVASFGDTSEAKLDALRAVFGAAEGRHLDMKARAAAYAAEAARHKAIMDRVKARATELLQARRDLGLDPKVPGVVRLQLNGGMVPLIIVDEAAIPAEWRCAPTAPPPDTERIRAALQAGETVPGVELGTRGEHARWA